MVRELKSTGPAGPIILSVFGAVWAILGLYLSSASPATWLGPVAIGVILISVVVWRSRGLTPPPPAEGKRIGKLVGIWSGIEGVAIFISINFCANLGRPDLILAAICLIVGLHFFPLARSLPVPLYYWSCALLSVLGLAGLLASSLVSPPVVAFGAALILWVTVVRILV
ncbi:MAG: hypothetical protein H7315_09850 [Herminiimonas sp.]|nr:hypothetical protein [Herminiimonas sp.]